MTATFRRANFAEILLVLRQHLADKCGLDKSFVIVTTEDDAPHHRGQRDILLVPGDERPDEGCFDGGGRVVTLRYRRVDIIIRTRRSTDRSDADLSRLTDEAAGHLRNEDQVFDACAAFHDNDESFNALALPIPPGSMGRPQPDRKDPSWLSSKFDITLAYLRDVDQTSTAP